MRRRAWIQAGMVAALGPATTLLGACLSTRGPVVPTGTTAPSFTLKSHLGTDVSLEGITASGPAMIVFYRGFW